jgi:F0F1-type ATP synthase delta subunit
MEHKKTENENLALPISIVTKVDVGRLLQEVTNVDEFLEQAAIRQSGTALKLPKTTKTVEEMVAANKLNLLVETDRKKLVSFLSDVREKAPEIHMSFSTEPSTSFIQKLAGYMRENIHPQLLIQVGLQPTIGAGFMMRTTNKYYDFSLRSALKAKHQILIDNIRSTKSVESVEAKEKAA